MWRCILQVWTSNCNFDLPGQDPMGKIHSACSRIRASLPHCPQVKVKVNTNSQLYTGSSENWGQRSQVCISCPLWMNNENVNVKWKHVQIETVDAQQDKGIKAQDHVILLIPFPFISPIPALDLSCSTTLSTKLPTALTAPNCSPLSDILIFKIWPLTSLPLFFSLSLLTYNSVIALSNSVRISEVTLYRTHPLLRLFQRKKGW